MSDETIMPPMLDVTWDGEFVLVEARLVSKADLDKLISALAAMRGLLPE